MSEGRSSDRSLLYCLIKHPFSFHTNRYTGKRKTYELHKQSIGMPYQNKPQPYQPAKPCNRYHHHSLYGRQFVRRKMRRRICAGNPKGILQLWRRKRRTDSHVCGRKDRSWCTSDRANDHRAVTIEVANDGGADTGWHVSDKALSSLIILIADICRRNHIRKLKWLADKRLIGQIEKQNMTVHRWFAAKACPGDYLYNKHPYIAAEVNKLLGAISDIATPPASTTLPDAAAASSPPASSSADSKLQIPSQIKAVQSWLNTHYRSALSLDGIYGPKTKKRLSRHGRQKPADCPWTVSSPPQTKPQPPPTSSAKALKGFL